MNNQPQKARSSEHCRRAAKILWDKIRKPLSERFWEKVKVGIPNDCWEWMGCRTNMGYGCFSVNNRMRLASRVAYELKNEKIPEGLCVLHKCDNPPCCNPNHLFLGTRTDNHIDKMEKGRQRGPTGEKHFSHKLTENEVISIRKEYGNGGTSFSKIAVKYRVSKSAVGHAISKLTWKHIP